MSKSRSATPKSLESEALELRYVPLSQAGRWDANPKLHDLDRLVRSIETHGFGDPPKYDSTLGGLVYGNGRTEALERLKESGSRPPRGIGVTETGDWALPVIFGVDAESKAAAVAFAVDHNNLTLLGGDLGFTDLLQIWDESGLQAILEGEPESRDYLTSLDTEHLDALLTGPDFEPIAAADQSRLDQKKLVTCPECGHAFKP